ncbi:MAG: twin-arginine translocase TatA/TatE family subunit [Victivallales bacterium]|nr:twin-arginine translocase TatA/TatE family subunit [Victivallales bacterium]
MLGYQELLVIFVLALLFFGGRKIPEVARGLGKGIREFKKAKDEIADSLDGDPEEPAEDIGDAAVTGTAEPEADKDKSDKAKKVAEKNKEAKKKDGKKRGKKSGKKKKLSDDK